jgi:hypothetical protein
MTYAVVVFVMYHQGNGLACSQRIERVNCALSLYTCKGEMG